MEDVVTDKGYHSGRCWKIYNRSGCGRIYRSRNGDDVTGKAKRASKLRVYSKRAAHRREPGQAAPAPARESYWERSFAHVYDTGRMRRTHLRGHRNILKRLLLHVAGVQPEPDPAPGSRSGHTAGPARPPEPPIFLLPGRLDDPEEPLWKLGLAAGNFCGQISDSPVWGSGTERCLKNAISTTAC